MRDDRGSRGKLRGTGRSGRRTVVDQFVQSKDTLSIILRTLDAVDGTRAWRDFLRPDALKVFVPISDDNANSETARTFDAKLVARHGALFGTSSSRRYVFYPIVGAAEYPAENRCGEDVYNNGAVYLDLAKLTTGKWFPVCHADFGRVFKAIGEHIARAVACELPIPQPPDGEVLDPDHVNVKIVDSRGGATDIVQDATKACASGADGWQYSRDGTSILLCGAACESARADHGASVSVEFGCRTRTR